MQESKLLGTLLPALPELQQIVKNIRERYGIPDVNPSEDGITEIILTDQEIDWDEVRKDIDSQIRDNPDLLPVEYAQFLPLRNQMDLPSEPDIYEPISDDFRKKVTDLYKFYVAIMKLIAPLVTGIVDQYYETLTNSVIEYLITGVGREVPADWFGKVITLPVLGSPVVFAAASSATDPKWIKQEFASELTKTFGKDRSKLKDEQLNTAELLAMKLSGKSLKDIIDVDMARNPSNYPFDRKTKSYKKTFERRRDMLEKRFERLQDFIDKLSGDKK